MAVSSDEVPLWVGGGLSAATGGVEAHVSVPLCVDVSRSIWADVVAEGVDVYPLLSDFGVRCEALCEVYMVDEWYVYVPEPADHV